MTLVLLTDDRRSATPPPPSPKEGIGAGFVALDVCSVWSNAWANLGTLTTWL